MTLPRRQFLRLSAIGVGGTLAGCAGFLGDESDTDPDRVDDWQYDPQSLPGKNASGQVYQQTSGGSASADLGFAAGGATNVATYRRNIEEGYLPVPESLPSEGLFYNYYFDTGGTGECSSLFCPTYSTAITDDPLGETTDRFLTVGLNSTLTVESFERKRLNVVIVLDISGSMQAQFDQYYYDRFGNKHTVETDDSRTKLAVAKDALVALTDQLRPDDRVGVVLFNSAASVAKPLRRVEATDMDAIREHIQADIQAGGGTNLGAGMTEASDMLSEDGDADPTAVETRQIVITDAMPNTGQTDDESLQDRLEDYAADGIHTSFVGVGVDFNPALVDQITAVRGANYRSVHSASEFESYLGEEFEYMVTPLVYDLEVELDAEGAEIAEVYGSTAAEAAKEDLLTVNTLFPSPREDDQTRGGVVLVRLTGDPAGAELTLRAAWEDRTGANDETEATVTFPDNDPEYFANSGVRKAILLARYTDLLKNWMVYERDSELIDVTADDDIDGFPEDLPLGEWEQQSQSLSVSPPYVSRLEDFREHVELELAAIGDDSLEREVETLDAILAAS